jgi:uncharacterized protein YgbK (DUF1537 family)
VRIVADDLTGAADAAVAFLSSHRSVRLGLGRWPAGGDALAVDTNSRERPPGTAAELVRAALAAVEPDDELVLKIDSMLRGHVARSVAVLAEALPERRIVVAPAFPALGRTMRRGMQQGVDVHALLAGLPAGRVEVCDAASDGDLDRIVAAHRAVPTAWVGSGGITRALARRAAPRATAPARAGGPFLAVIGSTALVARAQAAALARIAGPGDRVATGRELPPPGAAGLVLLSGGATARAVLDRWGVSELDVVAEPEPGVVALRAPGLDALVVTKAGSFGDAGTLVRVVRSLRGEAAA